MSIIKLNNRAVKDATAVGSITGLGNLVFISRSTASSSSSLSITSGITSTYKEYIFFLNKIHPSAYTSLQFQTSTNGGSSYGVTLTSTVFQTTHDESGSSSSLAYETSLDLAQSTNFQNLGNGEANDSDAASSGFLHLFDPSSQNFVKHFLATYSTFDTAPTLIVERVAGYFNTTSAINAIQFKPTSGTIDSGTIDMYGIL